MRNAVKQKRIIMNRRELLNIQNQSIEGAVTSVMSYLKATQREKKGRERRTQIEKEETKTKKQVCRKEKHEEEEEEEYFIYPRLSHRAYL